MLEISSQKDIKRRSVLAPSSLKTHISSHLHHQQAKTPLPNMRFAFALLFADTVAFALMGADVYAKPTLDLDKRGLFPLVHVSSSSKCFRIASGTSFSKPATLTSLLHSLRYQKRNPNPSKAFCDCCSAKKEQRAVCCAGIYDCDCADCNPPVLEAAMEERDEDVLAARA